MNKMREMKNLKLFKVNNDIVCIVVINLYEVIDKGLDSVEFIENVLI